MCDYKYCIHNEHEDKVIVANGHNKEEELGVMGVSCSANNHVKQLLGDGMRRCGLLGG